MFNLLSRFVSRSSRSSKSSFRESAPGRALMLGLPSVLVAFFGVAAITWAEFGNKDKLIANYDSLAEKADEAKMSLANDINTERKLSATRQQTAGVSSGAGSKDDQRLEEKIIELNELYNDEEIYLEKLVSLNPDESDYRYRLAILALQKNDPQRCYSLMKSIAPDEEPGFAKAHLWMSKFYVQQRAQSAAQKKQYYRLALVHAENCLVRDSSNLDAKLIKAQLLASERRFVESYKVYEELFDDNPQYYRPLIELNRLMGGTNLSKNMVIIDKAQLRFKDAIDKSSVNYDSSWAEDWINLIECMRSKGDYKGAIDLLTKEEEKQKQLAGTEGTPEAASRHVHIKQLLTKYYTFWASAYAQQGESVESERKQLELLQKAISYEPNYPQALQLIARIAAGDTPAAAEARAIYDPETHDDAPSQVLNEMGSRSLESKKYDLAIKYFELARRKTPNDPQILNNLAYAYLICENSNPDRALTLVNQAIRAISTMTNENDRKILESHFFDTRGRALLQMNRMDEAAASLEMAMQVRPENEEILQALIKCYEGRDELQADVFRNRLEAMKAKENDPKATDGE